MKFFLKQKKLLFTNKCLQKPVFNKYYLDYNDNNINLNNFTKFIIKNGSLMKEKKSIITVLQNFNYFFYFNYEYIIENYPIIK